MHSNHLEYRNNIVFAFLLLVVSATANAAAPNDFVGNWVGLGYSCYDSFGRNLTSYPREDIKISYVGNKLVATKITGDPCVTAGQDTWIVEVGSSISLNTPYKARWHGGWSDRPNHSWSEGSIVFVSNAKIVESYSQGTLTFIRKTEEVKKVEKKAEKKAPASPKTKPFDPSLLRP